MLRICVGRCGRSGARLGVLLVLGVISLLFTFPSSADAARTVRVGVFPAAPLVHNSPGAPQGLFIDLIEHFAESLDWQVQYVDRPWSDLLVALEKGEIDLLPAVAVTDSAAGYLRLQPGSTLHRFGRRLHWTQFPPEDRVRSAGYAGGGGEGQHLHCSFRDVCGLVRGGVRDRAGRRQSVGHAGHKRRDRGSRYLHLLARARVCLGSTLSTSPLSASLRPL